MVLTQPAQPIAGDLVGVAGPFVRHYHPPRSLQPLGDCEWSLIEEGEVFLVVSPLAHCLIVVNFGMKPGLDTLVDSSSLELSLQNIDQSEHSILTELNQ